jgi:hypothetical protein
VGALLAPLLDAGWTLVLAAAGLSLVPLVVFLRGRDAKRYPGALTRLFVFRGFLYAQLTLPLLAAGGVTGAVAGAPFGAAARGGRAALAAVAAGAAAFAVAGWMGSRRLRVRRLRAHWPDLPPALDGLRIAQLSDLHVGPQTSRRFLARVRAPCRGAPRPGRAHRRPRGRLRAATWRTRRRPGRARAPLGVYAVPRQPRRVRRLAGGAPRGSSGSRSRCS